MTAASQVVSVYDLFVRNQSSPSRVIGWHSQALLISCGNKLVTVGLVAGDPSFQSDCIQIRVAVLASDEPEALVLRSLQLLHLGGR